MSPLALALCRSLEVETDDFSMPLELMIYNSRNYLEVQNKSPLLLNETEHEIDLGYYRGSGEGFAGWQQLVDPTYHQRPFVQRIAVAEDLMRYPNEYDVIRRALSLDATSPRLQILKLVDGGFLNSVADHFSSFSLYNGMSKIRRESDGTSPHDVFLCISIILTGWSQSGDLS